MSQECYGDKAMNEAERHAVLGELMRQLLLILMM